MKYYRFSPIEDEENFLKAINYVVEKTTQLCVNTIGISLPCSSLTIFSHYDTEYEKLVKMLSKLGKPYNENNGPRIKLNRPIEILKNRIKYIRIRKPDPYRMQVGCNDFDINNYQLFKKTYLKKTNNLRIIERPEYEMIEFFNPDFDVLAYIVKDKK